MKTSLGKLTIKEGVTMRAFVFISIVCIGFFLVQTITQSKNMDMQEQSEPAYAKWGQIAMQKTKERYPKASIIDYLHVGKDTGEHTSIEKFKLWLREDSREFGVYIDITFENSTEKVINIKFTETDR